MSSEVSKTGNPAAAGNGAADSGSGLSVATYEERAAAPSEATVSALEEDILAPRFYTTDFVKLDKMNLESHRAEFEQILSEFRADNNKGHFIPSEEFKSGNFPNLPLEEFEEFLKRSCLGEFSGCLLYREISSRSTNPILKEAFKYITRDEGRHASFLTHTMRDLSIDFDLRFLTERKKRYNIPPRIMFYTVYLSEAIGYWRYITIYNQLEAHPENRFHPIFKWFGRWCEDEHRHARFFSILMRSQRKQVLEGLINHLLIRFFTLSVYMTMFLRDSQPASTVLYGKMGLDNRRYDLDVIKRCDEEASTVWGFKFQVDHPAFVAALDKMAANNAKLGKLSGKKGLLTGVRRNTLRLSNVANIARLFLMKTIKVN